MVTRNPHGNDGNDEREKFVSPHEILNTKTFDFSKKENLLSLHKILLDLNVRSIGDLEVAIARA